MRLNKKLIIIILLIAFIFVIQFESNVMELNEITVKSNDLPYEFDGTKIAVIGDFHYGEFCSEDEVADAVELANSQNPDMVVLVGDYVTDNPDDLEVCFNQLSKLEAPLGVYAIAGNHDPFKETKYHILNSGIENLNNDYFTITKGNSKIYIGGSSNPSIYCPFVNGEKYNVVNKSDFVILSYHNPNNFPRLNNSNVDLILAGHNHGGQVNFFGYSPMVAYAIDKKQYLSGLFEDYDSQMVVTNGIGKSKIPIRFMARPQVTIVTLEREISY